MDCKIEQDHQLHQAVLCIQNVVAACPQCMAERAGGADSTSRLPYRKQVVCSGQHASKKCCAGKSDGFQLDDMDDDLKVHHTKPLPLGYC